MTRYWWVNHNATFRQEIGGSCLWSPQREKRNRSRAYDNMLRIQPNDVIISYARQQNAYFGLAADVAQAAPQPAEFGSKGDGWAKVGWFVPVSWTQLTEPVRHRDFWEELAPLLPSYSPISRKTGSGNQKIYLAEVPAEVFQLLCAKAGLDPQDIISLSGQAVERPDPIAELEAAAAAAIASDQSLDDTVRRRLIAARRGQGAFRAAVRDVNSACRVTGLAHDLLLVASHIMPWRSCSTGQQRLDGHNGLMLAPHIDRLFDRGLISFEDDGRVLVSPHLKDEHLDALGCRYLRHGNIGPFLLQQRPYLKHHREVEFLADPDVASPGGRKVNALAPGVAV